MVRYAKVDIVNFDSFEFQYGTIGNETYNVVCNCSEIKEITEDTFEFNGIIFDLNLVIPCC